MDVGPGTACCEDELLLTVEVAFDKVEGELNVLLDPELAGAAAVVGFFVDKEDGILNALGFASDGAPPGD